jgi:hypothetical protein
MINTTGRFITTTVANLDLTGAAAVTATTNASNIVRKVINAYEETVGAGHVGRNGRGVPANFRRRAMGPNGLVYGRIQSGKTRAMITSTAMAFDNGFRIAIVMTSNINDLVSQTHGDFSRVLAGVRVFTKDDELADHVEDAKLDLSYRAGRILLITSKGGPSLRNVAAFLTAIDASNFPMLIFDDEGDQASLDTNIYRRSRSGNLTLAKSAINNLIGRMRNNHPACVYVSVTGTPQAVLLQTASTDNKPSFIEMLPAGNEYMGGDTFFSTDEPENNPQNLISVIPDQDQARLLNPKDQFPEGLRDAILFFLLAASAAKVNVGEIPTNGYQFLCHPSLRNNEQDAARARISTYITEIRRVLLGNDDTLGINAALNEQYRILRNQLGTVNTPAIGLLRGEIEEELLRNRILVINATNTRRRGINYGPGFNFLIGGNTLGRGIAIPNLLVTYYLRQAVTSQMDTMYQHARMFGYRQPTLHYTKLFTIRALYYRFRDIHASDRALRTFIEQHINDDPRTFPIDIFVGLRATRTSVVDANNVDYIIPGAQIYPNRMRLPQPQRTVNQVWNKLYDLFGVRIQNQNRLVTLGKPGILITIQDAIELIGSIRTNSENAWHDSSIQAVLTKLSETLDGHIRLRYRPSQRTILEGGVLSSGTLSGAEQATARRDQYTTLWIMDVTPIVPVGHPVEPAFIFPTIVVPSRLPSAFVFSKK